MLHQLKNQEHKVLKSESLNMQTTHRLEEENWLLNSAPGKALPASLSLPSACTNSTFYSLLFFICMPTLPRSAVAAWLAFWADTGNWIQKDRKNRTQDSN